MYQSSKSILYELAESHGLLNEMVYLDNREGQGCFLATIAWCVAPNAALKSVHLRSNKSDPVLDEGTQRPLSKGYPRLLPEPGVYRLHMEAVQVHLSQKV
ncbi:hypothetical protein J6590_080699 [Homalodisca vitripennis]|nr:hypothetical protein J6590_080699 [Homalodisca vitripennis]